MSKSLPVLKEGNIIPPMTLEQFIALRKAQRELAKETR